MEFLGIDSKRIYNDFTRKKAYRMVQSMITIQMVNKRRKGYL